MQLQHTSSEHGDTRSGTYIPLIAHGTYLEATCTVFATEAIALDEASAEADKLIRRHV